MSEQAQVEKLTKIYCEYQDKLLQITKKNRSIVLKRLNDKYNFDLIETEKIKAGTLKKIISNLVKSSTSSTNILPDRSYDQKSDFARTKLKTLDRNLQAIEEETGSQVGYIGFPFLVGHVNDDFYIRGPLVLFPINLERKRSSTNAGWFVDTSDKKPILNGALISALKKKSKVSLPEDYESTFDDLIYDIQQNDSDDLDYVFFTKINNWIKNFIQLDESKNKSDPDSFSDINQNEIDALGKQPFHLVNYKIMGSFPQADNEIFKDYTELIQKASLDSPILNQLLEIKDNFSNESKAEGPAEISDY